MKLKHQPNQFYENDTTFGNAEKKLIYKKKNYKKP